MKFEKKIYKNDFAEWVFENGITVVEKDFDFDLHCFAVYEGEKYLGSIFPATIDDMISCKSDLDEGNEPIDSGWEDGNGNTCSRDGWGIE